VANDMEPKRAYMLATHTRRIGLPGAFLTVCDARVLPSLRSEGRACFDRVLADVPCSGDGTLRKNGGIVKLWKCGDRGHWVREPHKNNQCPHHAFPCIFVF